MKLFLDSANLDDIRECISRGIVSGVTVNQSLLAKEPKCNYKAYVIRIGNILPANSHLSVPFVDDEFAGSDTATAFNHPIDHAFKVSTSWGNLPLMRRLSADDWKVNATCVFSVQQADMAIAAGASIVSVFVGRANDAFQSKGHGEGYKILTAIKKRYPDTTVLAGSIRTLQMIDAARDAGADIATVSRTLLEEMANEIHSTQSAEKFNEDYQAWISR